MTLEYRLSIELLKLDDTPSPRTASVGLRESRVHDVGLTREAPNRRGNGNPS